MNHTENSYRALRDKCGQALIELSIGLMIVVLLVGGLIQLVPLYMSHSEMLAETRGLAGGKALNPITLAESPEYIIDWDAGDDGLRHTTDDIPVIGNNTPFRSAIIDRSSATPEGWDILDSAVNDTIPGFRDNLISMTHFGLVQHTEEREIPVEDDIIRNWAYPKESITLSVDVWMPQLGNVY